ncbi:MAG: ABC transporter substrate-binding protein [Candidatus Atribacteria bacterium]|nr:ABC transporter substrate-binding protein [Candidatus Atribacteria bacterium]
MNSFKVSIWIIVISILIGSFAIASAEEDVIKVGVMYSLTGTGAPTGKVQNEGALLAAKEVNEAGGITIGDKKYKVEAVVRDDETKPDVAVRRYREYIEEGITTLVSGTFAHVSTAINEQALDGSAFVMITNSIEEAVFRKGNKAPFFLTSQGAVDAIGRMTSEYVIETFKPKYVIACLPDYAYGQGVGVGMKQVYEKHPEIKIEFIWTPVGTPDYTSYILKIIESKPDVVQMGQWGTDGIEILKQAYELGLSKHTKIFYNAIVESIAAGIPPEALNGVAMGMWLYHDLSEIKEKDPETFENAERIRAAFMKEYGEQPDVMAAYAYIGMKETLRAIEVAQSTDPAKMYQALMENPNFMSFKGPAYWRPDGRPFYKYAYFVGEGKGAEGRIDKWDFAKITDFFETDVLCLPLSEMGYE